MLTEREVLLIKSSWEVLKLEGVQNPLIFYDSFFEADPGARKYFAHRDFKKLGEKFSHTIDFVITNCHNLEEVKESIHELGIVHNKLKIEEQHYHTFNQAILKLLDKFLSYHEDVEEIKKSWLKTLEFIVQEMKKAPDKKVSKLQKLITKMFG